MEGDRRLAAIMFTDMAGFTALSQRDERLSLEVLEEQRTVLRSVFPRFRGREVKTMGDAFLAEFPSALEAVECAAEIQSVLRDANDKLPEERRMRLRIGIHLGDVVHSGEDVAGDAVNVASRIEPLAPPGGVCVSSQVRDSVANKGPFLFEPMGRVALKNVSTPMEVFKLAGYGGPRTGSAPPRELPAERVAVLPLVNISRDPADEYFADGLTEELISAISRTEGIRVIARTSVMKYKGTTKGVSEIGRDLNAGSVLEGSVRKSGERLRVAVKLVSAADEVSRWSEEYDRELKDIFEVQEDIGRKVAASLRLQVLGRPPLPPASAEAHIDYLRGRQAWGLRTEHGLRRSLEFYSKALSIDPSYAMAYAGLADSYGALALLELARPVDAFPKAKDAVTKALAFQPRLAEAHSSMGLALFQYDWDWAGAEGELKEALNVNPSYAPAHHYYADYLKAMGRFGEALAEVKRALELDPLNLAINAGLGHVLYLSRRYDEAIEQYARAVELDPGFTLTHIWFGRPYLQKGMFNEAIRELQTAVALSGESTLALGMLGHGLAASGRREDALAVLRELEKRAETRYVPSYWIAAVHNGLGDRDKTLYWLRKAFEERSSWLVWANVEPRFDWLRGDVEFSAMMKAMKFPRPL